MEMTVILFMWTGQTIEGGYLDSSYSKQDSRVVAEAFTVCVTNNVP